MTYRPTPKEFYSEGKGRVFSVVHSAPGWRLCFNYRMTDVVFPELDDAMAAAHRSAKSMCNLRRETYTVLNTVPPMEHGLTRYAPD